MKVKVIRNSKIKFNDELVNLFPDQFVGQVGEVFAEKRVFYGIEFEDDLCQWVPKDCCEVVR